VATRPRNSQELGERAIRLSQHAADRPAEADHGIERGIREAAQVEDVEQLARLDRALDRCGLLGVQLELPGRDIACDDPRSEASQLEREAARTRPRVEDAVAVLMCSRRSRRWTSRPMRSIGVASKRSHSRGP
jgi:hypothetical protein